jgi:hypothetical protein
MPDEIKKEAAPVETEEKDAAEISDKDLNQASGGGGRIKPRF